MTSINRLSFDATSVLPIEEIAHWAHDVGAKVLVDACQSVPHMVVDVESLNVDFLAASSHKMCGPTGIGFLYGKSDILSTMPPFLGGGEMISDVYLDHSTYADPPSRFEAGTPAIGETIGFGAAIDYYMRLACKQFMITRWSSVDICTKACFLCQIFASMDQHCQINAKELPFVLSMLRTYILLILQHFWINR
ncbi:hypothetical protein QN277_019522 [Acacia crassicarpa]|uniref:Aminotransferase class V domain-containing protein n=1 Tax=Acacia crassicarpa TaxID=499986 RepID=A0AAE1JM07_9FABA|nr:hypothetical protein QN277_019522 [Acacia crassicarpa]